MRNPPAWSVSRRWIVVAVAVLLTACGSDGGESGDAGSDGGNGAGSGGTAPQPLDCERDGYPCSWSEADPAAAQRTDQLLAFSSLLLSDGATAEELAGRLEAASDVVEVAYDEITVWFRVEGAVPVDVYVDPTEGGLIEGAVPPLGLSPATPRAAASVLAQGATFSGCQTVSEDSADGEKGPVGRTGEPKKALILGPWDWQMEWEPDTIAALLRLGSSDYELEGGGVTTILTTQDRPSALGGDPAVRLEDFCGWESYDTIMIKTHGRTVCSGSCHTSLSVGRFAEDVDTLRAYAGGATGVTFATSRYGNLLEGLTTQEAEECARRLEEPPEGPDDPAADACLEKLPKAGHMEVTTDFFRANYGGGLKDRMIFFSACQGMKEGDLAAALRGTGDSSGAILGFDRIVFTSVANRVMEKFAEWVALGKAIDRDALDELNAIMDDYGVDADVTGQIEGEIVIEAIADVAQDGDEATRGSDIVSLHTSQGGPVLTDGGNVTLLGAAGDGEADELELGLRLTGVAEDESPDDYPIEVRLDGRELDLDDYEWEEGDRDTVWEAEVVADVGADLDPDERFDLEIRTVLPDAGGAVSRWEYENIRVGAGCYFRYDYDGSVQTEPYSGPIGGTVEFTWIEGPDGDDPDDGTMRTFALAPDRSAGITGIILNDFEPVQNILNFNLSDTAIPFEETGVFTVPGGVVVSTEYQLGTEFAGDFEIVVTTNTSYDDNGTLRVGTLTATFRSLGDLELTTSNDIRSGSITVTGGEFAFDRTTC